MTYRNIAKLADETPCSARINSETGYPRLIINGRETPPFAAWSWGLVEAASIYREAGIRILHPILGLNIAYAEDGQFDFSGFDTLMDDLLGVHPEAFFLPRILFEMPDWWLDANPAELVKCALPLESTNPQYSTQRMSPEGGMRWNNPLRSPSLASARYLDDVTSVYSALLRHFEESPLSSRIIGYQVGGGIYGEWHHAMSEFLPDESQPAANKIGSPPPLSERIGSGEDLLRNPETEAHIAEYYRRFHNDLIGATLLEFARITKAETGGRVLCGAFYGYLLENSWIHEGGHLAAQMVFDSPLIDFVASPFTYQTTNIEDEPWWNHDVVDGANNYLGRARGVAGDGGYRVLLESLRRRGILYFVEADSGTCLCPLPGDLSGPESDVDNLLTNIGGEGSETLDGTIKVLARDLGRMWAGGSGGWLFDFGAVLSTGKSWYDLPEVRQLISEFQELMGRRDKMDLQPVAEVGAVYDPESFFWTQHWRVERPNGKTSAIDYFGEWFLDSQARALHRLGAPVDYLYQFDLQQEDADRFKLLLVVNHFAMSTDEVDRYRQMLKGSGMTVVWMYAPGYIDKKAVSLDNMSRLTGFEFEMADHPKKMLVKLDEQVGGGSFGIDRTVGPRFSVPNGDEILGRWQDNGEPALARREDEDGWTSVYAGTAPLPTKLLRTLGENAGVKCWSDRDDIVVGTDGTAMVVATSEGQRSVELPSGFRQVWGRDDGFWEFGEVRLFSR